MHCYMDVFLPFQIQIDLSFFDILIDYTLNNTLIMSSFCFTCSTIAPRFKCSSCEYMFCGMRCFKGHKCNEHFNYIKYYKIDIIRKELVQYGESIEVSVFESFKLTGNFDDIHGDITQIEYTPWERSNFHSDMVCSLVNGQPKGSFLGGVIPKASVNLIVSDSKDVDLVDVFKECASRSQFINKSGSLVSYEPISFDKPAHYTTWTQNDIDRLWGVLEMYDSILILTAGNDYRDKFGYTAGTEYFSEFMKHPYIMQRIIIVGNYKPLDHPQSIDIYNDVSKIDDIEQITLENGSEYFKKKVVWNVFKRIYNIDSTERLRIIVAYVKKQHLGTTGEIVSYSAGIARDHFVLVMGTDIYAPHNFGKMKVDKGSSQAAPILTSILALWHNYMRFDSTKTMLRRFKQEYCTSIGNDPEIFGLGEPNIVKMFQL